MKAISHPRSVCFLSLAMVLLLGDITAVRGGSIFDDDTVPPTAPARPPESAPPESSGATPPAAPAPPAAEANQPAPSSGENSVPTGPAVTRHEIPPRTELSHSRSLLKAAFAEQLKDRSTAARRKLAQTLLDESEKAGYSEADRFALITGAIDAAREGASLPLCTQAAQKLSQAFPVDGVKVETHAAEGMNLREAAPADAAGNVAAGLQLADTLAGEENFPDAFKVLSVVRPLAFGVADLRAAVARQTQLLEVTRAASERIRPSLEKLKTSPSDPQANQAVGSYYCFRLGRWARGLPLLARGNEAGVKQAAAAELAARHDPAEAARVAGAWWDLAEAQGTGEADAKAMKVHAASWYRRAKGRATGLEARMIEVRLQEAGSLLAKGEVQLASQDAAEPATLVNSFAMKLVRIGPGTFLMGSPPNEASRHQDETLHRVTLTRSFYMDATPVTEGQWKAVMEGNRAGLDTELKPQNSVTWQAAVRFCQKLSQIEGKPYRLPTEAEWEYACRAGSAAPYGPGKLADHAWYRETSGNKIHPVGQKLPNAWGLYDMHGEIWEWCSDYYGSYPAEPVIDPAGPDLNDVKARRVHRGGSWYDGSDVCRAACREAANPAYGDDRYGFRVCLDSGQ